MCLKSQEWGIVAPRLIPSPTWSASVSTLSKVLRGWYDAQLGKFLAGNTCCAPLLHFKLVGQAKSCLTVYPVILLVTLGMLSPADSQPVCEWVTCTSSNNIMDYRHNLFTNRLIMDRILLALDNQKCHRGTWSGRISPSQGN